MRNVATNLSIRISSGRITSIGLLALIATMTIGCSGGGGGSPAAAAPATPAPETPDPSDLSVTSNVRLSSSTTDLCIEYVGHSCFFSGGQIVKYSDGSIILLGAFATIYANGGDTDTDQNAVTVVLPGSITGGYIKLSDFVARGSGFRAAFLVYVKASNTAYVVYDTDNDGVAEDTDETLLTLTQTSW
ncbi:MAG: hypothetical protein J0L82_10380 [Deltaproteobacteria bacterium]|nr:hypothetical protein [Deltaproteobacteria bacterium]